MSDYPIHYICEDFLGGSKLVVDEDTFEMAKRAKIVWTSLRAIEDLFSIAMRSYISIEKFLLTSAIDSEFLTHGQRNDQFFDDIRDELNLKLTALLNACRSYYEQSLSRMTAAGICDKSTCRQVFSSAFDTSLEYRIMDALRNHSMHQQMPIESFSVGGRWLYQGDDKSGKAPGRRRLALEPKLNSASLVASEKINAKTKDEIAALDCEYIDLKFAMRGYVAQIGSCHIGLRKLSKEAFVSANTDMEWLRLRLGKKTVGKARFPTAIRETTDSKKEKIYIGEEIIDRLEEQRQRLTQMPFVQRLFFSNEITKSKETYPNEHQTLWISD